jgi:DNA helicase II / ATP-dependent DNA helicase PcrA
MTINEEAFLKRYAQLNVQQKEAVDQVYGPVTVVAGPGTGKTEVLSMRIANLLRSDVQVQPYEILCLTYTEEATNSMRRRLVQIIGPEAHKIHIHTFHAFCNNIIQTHSELFGIRNLQNISDLERTELLHDILENLPQGHALRKLSGNIYYNSAKLYRLFELMKREHLRYPKIAEAIDRYIESLPFSEDYIYRRNGKGFSKGDLKQNLIDEEIRRMNDTKAAAGLFELFEQKMNEAGRYDFNDMIIWVIDAFKQYPWLQQMYQERYQFILVDEFQDTNGAQNELLTLLTSFWQDPNIFVVGDDDQSIYEFQGARIANIGEFYERYRENIKIVVLPHNYRSSQPILDKATALIKNNQQRLIHKLKELNLNKDIISASDRFKDEQEVVHPVVKSFTNPLHEEAHIVEQIEELMRGGVALRDVAILYSQHRQAENIIRLLERKGIPYNVRRPVNILELPLVEHLINIFRYLDAERKRTFSAEDILFQIMHVPCFGIKASDIALLSLYMQTAPDKKQLPKRWRLLLNNLLLLESLEIDSAEALFRLGSCLDRWETEQTMLPLPLLFEKIIYESGIVSHLLKDADHVWNMQVLFTFFEFIKEAHGRHPSIKISDLLLMLDKMDLEGLTIPLHRVVQHENGIHFYTAHSAKGNEFEYVFLIGCNKLYWEGNRNYATDFKLPETLTQTKDDTEKSEKTEVSRRLFFVALTRAKKYLQISYAIHENTGKPIENSVFVDEISKPEERIRLEMPAEALVSQIAWAMKPVEEVYIRIANAQWVDKVLQQLTMSATTLSKFLNCPLGFYYEQILRVPFQKNEALAFGSAVHNALELFFLKIKQSDKVVPTKEFLLQTFQAALQRESACFTLVQLERKMEHGKNILSDYYDQYHSEFNRDVEIEWKVPRYYLAGIPVTGKIDKIELDGNECTVVDYKTGDPDNAGIENIRQPDEKNPFGGDYWRQMIFYKMLIENFAERNWVVNTGIFDFVQKNKQGVYKRFTIPMYKQDEEMVMKLLKDSYAKIMNHEFDKGCGREDCHWCNFARKYQLIRSRADEMIEIDDI